MPDEKPPPSPRNIAPDPSVAAIARKLYARLLRPLTDVVRGATVGGEWVGDRPGAYLGEAAMAGLPVAQGMKALREFVKASKGTPLAGQAFANLADTLQLGETVGEYGLKPEVIQRLRSLYELGTGAPRTSNWAGAPSEELIQAFGGDRDAAIMWARFWGATSPNTSVPRNTEESVRAWLRTLEYPEASFTVPRAQQMGITMAPSKVPNLNRALWNEPLSPGTKVEAMAGYMAGEERIPIDVHALYALTGQKTLLDPQYKYLRALMAQAENLPTKITKGVGLTQVDLYKRYEEALKKALREIDPERPVTAVFADLWEGARTKDAHRRAGRLTSCGRKGCSRSARCSTRQSYARRCGNRAGPPERSSACCRRWASRRRRRRARRASRALGACDPSKARRTSAVEGS